MRWTVTHTENNYHGKYIDSASKVRLSDEISFIAITYRLRTSEHKLFKVQVTTDAAVFAPGALPEGAVGFAVSPTTKGNAFLVTPPFMTIPLEPDVEGREALRLSSCTVSAIALSKDSGGTEAS